MYIRYPSTSSIVTYPTFAAFPTPGSGFGVAADTENLYYWDGTSWEVLPSGSGVTSVNSQVGVVTLDTDDIPEGAALYFTDERAQDAVGTILLDSSSVDLTYNDGAPSITADVLPAGVNHNALQNYVANQHVDHSAVVLTAGVGLSGGGDITASRTIDLENTAVTPGSYTSANLTVDAQGRLTAASSGTLFVALSANQSSTLGTPVDATGLAFTLAANTKYYYRFNLVTQTSVTAQAVRHAVTFSGTSTVFAARSGISSGTSGTGSNFMNVLSSTGAQTSGPTMAGTVPQFGDLEGIIVTSGSGGTLQLQFFIETAGNTATVLTGSNGQLWTLP